MEWWIWHRYANTDLFNCFLCYRKINGILTFYISTGLILRDFLVKWRIRVLIFCWSWQGKCVYEPKFMKRVFVIKELLYWVLLYRKHNAKFLLHEKQWTKITYQSVKVWEKYTNEKYIIQNRIRWYLVKLEITFSQTVQRSSSFASSEEQTLKQFALYSQDQNALCG